MKSKNYLPIFGLLAASLFTAFSPAAATAQQVVQPPAQAAPKADNEYQVGAILYMQKAAEYRALCYQAFNAAKMSLDADAKNRKKLPKADRRKPRAVVVDIDETMLDNSPAQADAVIKRAPFNLKDWYAWGEMRKAKAIPGAVEYANYATSKGVKMFYVSNRDQAQKQATIDNLKSAGFQDISAENVILRDTESTKEPRRLAIAQQYRIAVLIGDNLNDLSNVFEKKSVADRFSEVDKSKAEFGARFIVLPNAMYGDWESAIYEYQRLTEAQKAEKRANALELP